MPKSPVSVTLDRENLLWLRGRAGALKRRSLSEALDAIVTAARLGRVPAVPIRSVVGTLDISAGDPDLERADTYVRALFDSSVQRPWIARERPPARATGPRSKASRRRG